MKTTKIEYKTKKKIDIYSCCDKITSKVSDKFTIGHTEITPVFQQRKITKC